jgi:hypothetical protein
VPPTPAVPGRARRPGAERHEAAHGLVEHAEFPLAHVDEPAVQLQPALLDTIAHAAEGHQVAQRKADGEAAAEVDPRRRFEPAGGERHRARFLAKRHPQRQEAHRRRRLAIAAHQRPDAAALAVAEHDDVLHAQHHHRELERSAGAVVAPGLFVGRHQVGNVAHDEDVAWVTVEQDRRIDAGVAAGDHQHAGLLAFARDAVDELPLLAEAPAAESLPAGHQLGNRHGPVLAWPRRRCTGQLARSLAAALVPAGASGLLAP